MKKLDVEALISQLDVFAKERDWDQFHSVKNLSMALSVEAAELLELFQWLSEEESNRLADNPALLSKVEDEVADVLLYLLRIVARGGIDLEQAVQNKIRKNADKYPVSLSRGKAKKYTEF